MKRSAPLRRTPLKRKPYRIRKASPLTEAKLKKKLDILFSVWIRNRDKECAWYLTRDGKKQVCDLRSRTNVPLQCSHFYPRFFQSVRWDPENCITLCDFHHWRSPQHGWEYQKHADYRDYMLARLGEERYEALRLRAKTTRQFPRKELQHLIDILSTRPQEYESEYSELIQSKEKINKY